MHGYHASLSTLSVSVFCVVGLGVVGGAVFRWLKSRGFSVLGYDTGLGIGSPSMLGIADVIFICVPTPYAPGGYDLSHIKAVARAIPGRDKIVVLKSTVLPGTTDSLQEEYSHR